MRKDPDPTKSREHKKDIFLLTRPKNDIEYSSASARRLRNWLSFARHKTKECSFFGLFFKDHFNFSVIEISEEYSFPSAPL